jgi:carbohydrate-selective porin OprB
MYKKALIAAAALLAATGVAAAEDEAKPANEPAPSLWQRDTLSSNWFGLGDTLGDSGVTVSLSLTQVVQLNLHRGISTHRRSGRYAGSWDLELELDLEKILKLKGASVYAAAGGSFSDGIDTSSVGSIFGVNTDAGANRSIDLTELWYEQALFDGRLRFRIGKLDLGGGFDCQGCPVAFDTNAFANDETAQFLNGALVGNPTIPFPDLGLGAIIYVEPVPGWYFAAGVADAQGDARETGFNTAFDDEDYFFSVFEAGWTPCIRSNQGDLQGAYRIGFWYDPQDKDKHAGGVKRDDIGMYLSFDQVLWKEKADAGDTQGLGMFFRYGFADSDVAEVKTFWSVGGQYQGLVPSRDDDVLGVGYATGRLARGAHAGRHESVVEVYYNAQITPWLSVSPSLQYVWHPGGEAVNNAVVFGVRVQMAF